jgi:hypothetical protein
MKMGWTGRRRHELGLLAALAGVEGERGRRRGPRGMVRLQAGLGPLGPGSAGSAHLQIGAPTPHSHSTVHISSNVYCVRNYGCA